MGRLDFFFCASGSSTRFNHTSIGANTALFFLKAGTIQPGRNVLINGASGSVDTFPVQLARYYGADVTGVCSTGNVALVQSLDADTVIDYTQADFTQNAASFPARQSSTSAHR